MAGGRRPNTGGARPGAGRKKGVPNKTTKAVKERVLKSGKTPLEMMVEIARYHFTDFLREARKQTKNRDEAAIMTKSKAALDAAEKAAPYMHTRMASEPVSPRH